MFGGILTKLQNTLEAIDDQAAANSGQANNNFSQFDGNDNISDEVRSSLDYESLVTALQRSRIQISSLDEQLKLLTQENARLKNELEESELNLSSLKEKMSETERQRKVLKGEVSALEKKQQADTQNFEKMKTNMEELRQKLEKDLASVSQQNSSLQHELQMKQTDNAKLTERLQSQELELKSLEEDVLKYREKAVKTLTDTQNNSSAITEQLELLEAERTRLKERYSRAQQKITQLETSTKEIEEQMQNEIGEVKLQQVSLENELFRERTQNEALTHELGLVRSQLFASREQAETKLKAMLQAERSEHRAEIARIREEQTRRNTRSSEEKIIEMNAMIENLKSEKAALMLMLENNKSANEDTLNLGVGISRRQRRSQRSISSLVPVHAPAFIDKTAKFLDRKLESLRFTFSERPLLFLFFVVWFIIANICWIL